MALTTPTRAVAGPGPAPGDARPAPVVVWKNIGVLRGVAICLVVVHHATHWVYSTRRLVLASHPMSAWEGVVEVCGRGLPPVSVPAFLFASGYFVARFSSGWQAARSGALRVATRYLMWWAIGFAFFALARRELDLHDVLPHFLFGGPFIAYWFFPLIIQLLLVAPLLVAGCRRWPLAMAAAGAVIQALCIGFYYATVFRGLPHTFLWSQWNHVAVAKLPFFIYGILFSQHADRALAWLEPRRGILGWAAASMALVTCAEAVLLGRLAGDGGPASWGGTIMTSESASLHLFAWVAVAWVITRPSRPGGIREWLNGVGLKSLGILLLHDPVLIVCVNALWQARRLLGIATPAGIPPPYMLTPWWLPLAVGAGVGVPLVAMRWTERLLGKRAAAFLYG